MAAPGRQTDEPARPGIRETLRANPINRAIDAVVDGHVRAWFRQGLNELAEALKAFPDSIQHKSEIGGLFTPTSAEIARDAGVYGRSVDQEEGFSMHRDDPVSMVLENSRPGPAEPKRDEHREAQRGPTGDRPAPEVNPVARAMGADREQAPEPRRGRQAEQTAPEQGPVEQALDVARDDAIQPQATPPGPDQEQDLGRGR